MKLTKEAKEILRKSAEYCTLEEGCCCSKCPLYSSPSTCAPFQCKGILALLDRVDELEPEVSDMTDFDCLKEAYLNLELHCSKNECSECPYSQVEDCADFGRRLLTAIDKKAPQQYSQELVSKAQEILKEIEKKEEEEKLVSSNFFKDDKILIRTKKMELVLHRDIIRAVKLYQGKTYVYLETGYDKYTKQYYIEKLKVISPSYEVIKNFWLVEPKDKK